MTTGPAWAWELLDGADQVLDRPLGPTFSNRFDAESWLGESWRQLAEQGAVAARLSHNGLAVAAPIPLRKD
jgi:hypothetical protein